MNTESTTPDYLLIFRGTHWDKHLSPEEMQNVMRRWNHWFDDLQRRGKIKGANPLENEGVIVSGPKGRTVVDGPFAESKEAVAGYFLVQVASQEEAIAIAQAYPQLEYGMTVEIRPVADMCPGNRAVARMNPTAATA